MGLVLTVSIGVLVFATKKPIVLPTENNVTKTVDAEVIQYVVRKDDVIKYKTDNDNDDDDNDDDDNDKSGGIALKPIGNIPKQSSSQTQTSFEGITLSQISQHNSRASCWSVINGGVYDLTSWIPNHPGGEQVILSMCGVDGSAGYNGQHGGRSKITAILAGFKIGELAK